jgi:hypothetical protein
MKLREPVVPNIDKSRRIPSWRTLLMLAGSALLGGTAVALWNRRALSEIQGHSPARSRQPLDLENYRRDGSNQPDQSDDAA